MGERDTSYHAHDLPAALHVTDPFHLNPYAGAVPSCRALATNNSLATLDLRENPCSADKSWDMVGSFGGALFANTAMTDLKLVGPVGGPVYETEYETWGYYDEAGSYHGDQPHVGEEAQRQMCRWLGRNRARRYCDQGFTLVCTTCPHPTPRSVHGRPPRAKHSRQMGCCVKAPPYTPMTGPSAPSLTKIDVSRMMLGDDGLAVLASSISNIPTLTILDVSHNAIGSAGAKSLSKALRSPWSAVRSLVLGSGYRRQDAQFAASESDGEGEASRRCDRISSWSLQLTNRIGNEGATYLGQMLKENTSLTQLLLDPEIEPPRPGYDWHDWWEPKRFAKPKKPKSITSAGVAALSAGVKVNHHLRVLVLDDLEVCDQVSTLDPYTRLFKT